MTQPDYTAQHRTTALQCAVNLCMAYRIAPTDIMTWSDNFTAYLGQDAAPTPTPPPPPA